MSKSLNNFFTLRDLLENPDDYADTPDIGKEIDRLKIDLNRYFEDKKTEVADQVSKYKDDALKATRLADKIGGVVRDKAKNTKKPFVTPLIFARKEDEDEILFVDNYDSSHEALLEEMIKGSVFVVDVSVPVENFKVGRWVFVGESKNRGLYIFFPVNPIGVLDIAKDQLTMSLDGLKIELESEEETEKK